MEKELVHLCQQKTNKELDMSWEELAKKHGYVNGEALRCAWKSYRRCNGILPSRESKVAEEVTNKLEEIDMQIIELKKEKVKLRDQRTVFNRIVRESARYEYLVEELKTIIDNSNLPELKIHKQVDHMGGECEILAVLSDLHYGMSVDNHWNKFNSNVFADRLSQYVSKIIEIGKRYKARRLVVCGLGDYVSGNIHLSLRIANNENIIQQIQEVSEFISKALFVLANEFDVIDFYSAIGNHGRCVASKHESITAENFEHLISWYLKARLKDVNNIIIHDNHIDKDIIVAKVCGHTIFGCHGDRDKVTNIVQNLSLMMREIPESCYLGHLHHFACDTIQGVNVIMSGSMIGCDDYAKEIRKVGDACQTVSVYDSNGLVCNYNVVLK